MSPARISFPSPDLGTFKLSVNKDSAAASMPLNDGKLMTSPNYAHSNITNKWESYSSLEIHT